MATNRTGNRLAERKTSTLVYAIAGCFALSFVGFIAAEGVAHSLNIPNQAMPSELEVGIVYSQPAFLVRSPQPAVSAAAQVSTAAERTGATESPRECTPEKGINTACIFE